MLSLIDRLFDYYLLLLLLRSCLLFDHNDDIFDAFITMRFHQNPKGKKTLDKSYVKLRQSIQNPVQTFNMGFKVHCNRLENHYSQIVF